MRSIENITNKSKIIVSIILISAITLFSAVVYGWYLNLSAVMSAAEFTPSIIIRYIGIVLIPIGAILGYVN